MIWFLVLMRPRSNIVFGQVLNYYACCKTNTGNNSNEHHSFSGIWWWKHHALLEMCIILRTRLFLSKLKGSWMDQIKENITREPASVCQKQTHKQTKLKLDCKTFHHYTGQWSQTQGKSDARVEKNKKVYGRQ